MNGKTYRFIEKNISIWWKIEESIKLQEKLIGEAEDIFYWMRDEMRRLPEDDEEQVIAEAMPIDDELQCLDGAIQENEIGSLKEDIQDYAEGIYLLWRPDESYHIIEILQSNDGRINSKQR